MKERLVSARSLPEAYHAALRVLHEEGEVTPCPDYNTNQRELSMTIFVEEPLAEPLISKLCNGNTRRIRKCEIITDHLSYCIIFQESRSSVNGIMHRTGTRYDTYGKSIGSVSPIQICLGAGKTCNIHTRIVFICYRRP